MENRYCRFCEYVFNREMGYEWPTNSHIMTSLSSMISGGNVFAEAKIPTTTNQKHHKEIWSARYNIDGKDWGSVDTKDKPLDGYI